MSGMPEVSLVGQSVPQSNMVSGPSHSGTQYVRPTHPSHFGSVLPHQGTNSVNGFTFPASRPPYGPGADIGRETSGVMLPIRPEQPSVGSVHQPSGHFVPPSSYGSTNLLGASGSAVNGTLTRPSVQLPVAGWPGAQPPNQPQQLPPLSQGQTPFLAGAQGPRPPFSNESQPFLPVSASSGQPKLMQSAPPPPMTVSKGSDISSSGQSSAFTPVQNSNPGVATASTKSKCYNVQKCVKQ